MSDQFVPETEEIVLYRNCVEKFYKKVEKPDNSKYSFDEETGMRMSEGNRMVDVEITQDEFKQHLSDNDRVFCARETIVLAYNLEKTKLCFKKFNHVKAYVDVKGLNRKKFKVSRAIRGVTFDLVNKSVYSYERTYVRKRTSATCRVNSFYGKGLENARNAGICQESENTQKFINDVLPMLNDELNLKIRFTSLPDIMKEYYLIARNIDIVDSVKYFDNFFRLYKPKSGKYNNQNIFEILADIYKIKNPEYIKWGLDLCYYAFQEDKKKIHNINITTLKLCDLFQVPMEELRSNEYVYMNRVVSDYTYERESIKVMTLYNRLNKYYNLKFSELIEYDQHQLTSMLFLLDSFYSFGYKLKFEHFDTIIRRSGYYRMILQLIGLTAYKTGGVVFSEETVKLLQKSFTKKIRIKPLSNSHTLRNNLPIKGEFSPNKPDQFEHVGSINDSFVFRICYDKNQFYYIRLGRFNTVGDATYSKNIPKRHREELTRRIKLINERLETNRGNISEKFDVNIRFSNESFVDLCNTYSVDYNKYIEKIKK